jgi:hypothetical protein
VAVFSFSFEEMDVYVFLYNSAATNTAQLDILKSMAEAKLAGAGEFYAQALRRLLTELPNVKGSTERNAAEQQALILAALLGAERYTPSASDLWQLVETFDAPLVKAEALMSLGRIRATNYLPQVIRILNNTNVAPTADRLNGERVAFGAIIALEKFQHPSGFVPVFLAGTGWYSNRIRDQAFKSLSFIATDPTPFMLEIIKGTAYSYDVKLVALQTMEAADAAGQSKAQVALAALDGGWKAATNDSTQKSTLASMRKLALRMLTNNKTTETSVYPLLERSYTQAYDTEEQLLAIDAFAAMKSEESARRLSAYLSTLNGRWKQSAIRQEDERIVRALIPAIGRNGHPAGSAALNEVIDVDWTDHVKRLARDALKQLGS